MPFHILGSNQCKLYCGNILEDKVEDSTHCNSDSGVCVDGVCKKMPHYVDPRFVSASGKYLLTVGVFTSVQVNRIFRVVIHEK